MMGAQISRISSISILERIAIACTGKWRDLWYGTGSVSDLSLDKYAYLSRLRSLTLPVPYRIQSRTRSRNPPYFGRRDGTRIRQMRLINADSICFDQSRLSDPCSTKYANFKILL